MPVLKRGDRWYFDFTIRGKRYREAIPEARTKAQAEQAETQIKQSVYDGKYGKLKAQVTLEKFANETYLQWARENKRSAYHDEYNLRHLLPYFKGMSLQDITAEHVEQFKRKRRNEITTRKELRNPNTVNRDLALISKIFSLAVDYCYIENNPCRRVKFFKTDIKEKKVLSRSDEKKLLSVIPADDRLYSVILVALKTGMRRGKLVKLKWENIDFDASMIHIPAAITKGNRARSLPLMPDVKAIILSLRQRDRIVAEIFPGFKLSAHSVTARFTSACKKAGLEGYTFHSLRHTFSTRLSDAGATLVVVRDWMGHKTVQMTNHYTHATPEIMRQAMEMLEKQNIRHKLGTENVGV